LKKVTFKSIPLLYQANNVCSAVIFTHRPNHSYNFWFGLRYRKLW